MFHLYSPVLHTLLLFSVTATEQEYREREQLLQRLLEVENGDGIMPPMAKRVKLENEEGNGLDGWDMTMDTSLNNSLDDMHGIGMYMW